LDTPVLEMVEQRMDLRGLTDRLSGMVTDTAPEWWPELSRRCLRWAAKHVEEGVVLALDSWELKHVQLYAGRTILGVQVTVVADDRRLCVCATVTADADLGVLVIQRDDVVFEPDEELEALRRAAFQSSLPCAVKLLEPLPGFIKGQTLLLDESCHRYKALGREKDLTAPSLSGASLVQYPILYRTITSFP
jgi:hypothetical protein